jgi:hypothetical protein
MAGALLVTLSSGYFLRALPVELAPPPWANVGTTAADTNASASTATNQRLMLILLWGRPKSRACPTKNDATNGQTGDPE